MMAAWQSILGLLAIAAVLAFAWWRSGQGWSMRQRRLLDLNTLCEQILAAQSDAGIMQLLSEGGWRVFGPANFLLYHHSRATRSLELAGPSSISDPTTIDLDAPSDRELAACFVRSETVIGPRRIVVPLLAQKSKLSSKAVERLGVLEIRSVTTSKRKHSLTGSSMNQALAQHLGAVIGAALTVQEQRAVSEQMRRGEQLAMAGQLISSIASELRDPLEYIRSHANSLLARPVDSLSSHELRSISTFASQAEDTVARLIGFTRTDRAEVTVFDFNALLRGLLHFRDLECRTRGIELRQQLSRDPVHIEGVRVQIEEVCLQLLVQAEMSARQIDVDLETAGGSAVMHLGFARPIQTDETALPFSLCRSLVQAHGGELDVPPDGFRLRLPLALTPPASSLAASPNRTFTILLVEPDESTKRRLLATLGDEGHRVVPVASSEEGLDLMRRVRFDLAFCAVRLPGMKWLEFFEASRHQLACFVLMTEGFDASLGLVLRGAEAYVLRKPVAPEDIRALLTSIAAQMPTTLEQ